MKILHVSIGDSSGGAARAAHRIHRAQIVAGIESRMLVLHKGTDDGGVVEANKSYITSLYQHFRRYLNSYRQRGCSLDKFVYRNYGYNSAGLVKQINSSDADIINLHWICNMLSLKDVARLEKPIVWTMHDMWAFCGGEHYAPDGEHARFRCGYHAGNRPEEETGPDLNRRSWEAKQRAWARQHFEIVAPSHWLAGCIQGSVLFSSSPVYTIPNPLDTQHTWRPIGRDASRTVLGLPLNKKLLLFGAVGGTADPRKGADLLRESVRLVAARLAGKVELLVYGRGQIEKDAWPCPVHWLGEIRNDRVLVQVCSAADLMIVPSRQDNLPNTAIEAQACGTPVAAFNVGGLPDIVSHCETGWLATPFDTADLAEGILWLLSNDLRLADISAAARKWAVERYSEMGIAREYGSLYESLLGRGVS